jgi:cobalt/nickel transport system permease protein
MGAGHPGPGRVYRQVDSPVHRLAPEAKVAAAVAFTVAVVATPREAVWAFAGDVAVVLLVARCATVGPWTLLRAARLQLPFLAFAILLPVVGGEPRVDVVGVALSEAGLWAAWSILAKGTLGVLAATLLVATTTVPDILTALRRLRMPAAMVAIAGAMVRYLEVLAGEVARMDVARSSRAFDGRWWWQARAVAAGAGALFVRSYERGERVHLAMLSRGFDGAMPDLDTTAPRGPVRAAALPPLTAAGLAVLAVAGM